MCSLSHAFHNYTANYSAFGLDSGGIGDISLKVVKINYYLLLYRAVIGLFLCP